MKKNKLIVDYDYDFSLIGMISPVREFKIAWLLNQVLKIHLVKNEDIELEFIDNNIFISNFSHTTGSSILRLIKNKTLIGENQMIYLLPEMKEFDYLIMISGEGDSFDPDKLVETVKDIKGVQYATLVDITKLKSKENLIF